MSVPRPQALATGISSLLFFLLFPLSCNRTSQTLWWLWKLISFWYTSLLLKTDLPIFGPRCVSLVRVFQRTENHCMSRTSPVRVCYLWADGLETFDVIHHSSKINWVFFYLTLGCQGDESRRTWKMLGPMMRWILTRNWWFFRCLQNVEHTASLLSPFLFDCFFARGSNVQRISCSLVSCLAQPACPSYYPINQRPASGGMSLFVFAHAQWQVFPHPVVSKPQTHFC